MEIIPNPIYGYMRRSLLGHTKIDDSIRNELIEMDLGRYVYVGRLGRNNGEVSFTCEVNACTFRYHMRYTRGYEARGADLGSTSSIMG